MGIAINSSARKSSSNRFENLVRTSGGRVYAVLADTASENVEVYKADANNPTSFSIVGTYTNITDVQYATCAIDSSDIIHISWVDVVGKAPAVKYITFDTSNDTFGTIDTAVTDTGDEAGASHRSWIYLDRNDVPHIVYARTFSIMGTDSQGAAYVNFVGASWSTPVDFNSIQDGSVNFLKLIFDSVNIPYIVWLQGRGPGGSDDSYIALQKGNANDATSFSEHTMTTTGSDFFGSEPLWIIDKNDDIFLFVFDSVVSEWGYFKHTDSDSWTTWGSLVSSSIGWSGFEDDEHGAIFYASDGNIHLYYKGSSTDTFLLIFDIVNNRWYDEGSQFAAIYENFVIYQEFDATNYDIFYSTDINTFFWEALAHQLREIPTIVPITADAHEFNSVTPTLEFTGSDANNDDLEYHFQILSAINIIVDTYNESNINTSGVCGSNFVLSQSFTGDGSQLDKATFSMMQVTSPLGKMYAVLHAHTGTFGTSSEGIGDALAISQPIDVSVLTGSMTLIDFEFDGQFTLVNTTKYVIGIFNDSDDTILLGQDSSSPTHGGNKCTFNIGIDNWTSSSGQDIIFYVRTHTVVLDKLSSVPDDTFTNTTDGADLHPFDAGDKADYTVTSQEHDSYNESNANGSGITYGGGVNKTAQSFNGISEELLSAKFFLSKVGSPTGNIVVKLYAHSGTFGTNGIPTGSALATSETIDITTLTGTNTLYEFIFSTLYTMALGTNYFISVEFSGGDSSNYLFVRYDSSSPTHNGNRASFVSSWSDNNAHDLIFYIYTIEALAEATYYWRARAIDPLDRNVWSAWTTVRSFDIVLDNPDVTVTPAPVTAAFAVVEPVVTAVSNIEFIATFIAVAFALIAPTVALGVDIVVPAPLSSSFSIIEPVVTAEQNAEFVASELPVSFAVVEPTVTTEQIIDIPAPVTAAFAVVEPTVELGFIYVVPAPETAAFAIIEPTITTEQIISPAVLNAAFAIIEPVVNIDSNFVATFLTADFAIIEPEVITAIDDGFTATQLPINFAIVEPVVTVISNIDFGATQLPVNFAIVEPTINIDAGFIATVLNANFGIVEPIINIDAGFVASELPVNFAIVEPVVTAISNIDFAAPLLTAIFAPVEPVVNIDGGFVATFLNVSFGIQEPVITTELNALFVASELPVNFAIVEPVVNIDSEFTAPLLNANFAIIEPVVTAVENAEFVATFINVSFGIIEPVVSIDYEFIATVFSKAGGGGSIAQLSTDTTKQSNNNNLIGQSFLLTDLAPAYIDIGLSKQSSPVFNIRAYIYSISGGDIDSLLQTSSNVIAASSLTTSLVYYRFLFDDTEYSQNIAIVVDWESVTTNNGGNKIFVHYQSTNVYGDGTFLNNGLAVSAEDLAFTLNLGLAETNFTILEPTVEIGTVRILPAVLNVVFAIIAPEVQSGVDDGFVATELPINFAIVEPVINIDSEFVATVLNGAFAIVEPVVSIDTEFVATVLNAAFAIQEPAVDISVNIQSGLLTNNFAIVEPAITTEQIISPAVINADFAIVEPVVSIDSGFAAPLLTASFAISEPATTTEQIITPTLLNAIFGIVEPVINIDVIETAPLLQSTFAIVEPTVETDANVQISVLAAVFAIVEPSVTAGGNVSINVAVINSVIAIVEPTVQTDALITPGVLNVNFSLQEPAVNIDVNISTTVLNAAFAIQEPTVFAGGNVEINVSVINITFGIQEPVVNIDVETIVSQVPLTFVIQEPAVGGGVNIFPAVIGLVFQILEPVELDLTPTETIDEDSQITIVLNLNSYITTTLTLKSILDG